jgi:hypothetical protein
LSSIEQTRNYLANQVGLKVLDNLDYEGWLPGAIGIWASWKNSFNVFTKTDSGALILIEDDLWVTEDFVFRNVLKAVSELPSGWDYLTLFTPEPQRSDFSSDHELGLEYICLPYHTWSNAAVIFSQSGAAKILKHMSDGVMQNSDLYLYINKDNQLNGYALNPVVMADKISVYTDWETTVGYATKGKRYSKSELYESNE